MSAELLEAKWFFCPYCNAYLISEPDENGNHVFIHHDVWHPEGWIPEGHKVN